MTNIALLMVVFIVAGEITVAVESTRPSLGATLAKWHTSFTGADGGFSTKPSYDPQLKFFMIMRLHWLLQAPVISLSVKYHIDPEKFEEIMVLSFVGCIGF